MLKLLSNKIKSLEYSRLLYFIKVFGLSNLRSCELLSNILIKSYLTLQATYAEED